MADNEPTEEDFQQLKLLSIFHYVVSGLVALMGCFPIIHLVIGIAIVTGRIEPGERGGPPAEFGWIFIGMAACIIGVSWASAIVMVLAGRKLVRHSGWMFCAIVAGLECVFMPFGTVLGVFTLIVLMRPSVQALFSYGGVRSRDFPP